MKKHRKHYTPEEKVAILRRHLLEKEPISKLCDERGFCLRAESTAEPLRRAGADRVLGEEDSDQGRGPRRADGGACRAKKRDWGTLTGSGSRTTPGTRSWISSGAGPARPRSA